MHHASQQPYKVTFIIQLKQVQRDRVAGPWINRKVASPGSLLLTVIVSRISDLPAPPPLTLPC